jgi:AcrR family transcriptional regulator
VFVPEQHVRNSRGEGDKLRSVIVDAARALVDEGMDAGALSLRSIARAAGISAPSIYPHFASLDQLRAAVIDASFVELQHDIVAAQRGAGSPTNELLATCGAYFAFGRSHVERYRAMFSPEGYGPESGTSLEFLEQLISRCVAAGESVSTDVHGDAFLLWAAMHGMTTIPRPARREDWRLGASDRIALFETMVRRLAQLVDQGNPIDQGNRID